MPPKRKFSGRWTTNNNKRSRKVSGWKRSVARRTRVGRNRFPTYKFKRYITSISTGFPTNTWSEANLPFDMYPSSTAQTEWPITYAFTISDISAYSEFSSLFDRYMLVGCMLRFQLSANPNADVVRANQIGTLQSSIYPRLWYVIDHDDGNVETLAQLKQRGNVKCRVLQPNKPLRVYVPFPRTAGSVAVIGSTTASAAVQRPTWFDCGTSTVVHYGLKCVVDLDGLSASSSANGSPFRIKMDGVYYFKMKDVR